MDDAKFQAISAALGIFIPTFLTFFTRSVVVSQKTYEDKTEGIDPLVPTFDELKPSAIK